MKFLVLLLMLTFSLFADENYTKGLDAYNKQDYPNALIWFTQSADAGNIDAQDYLAYMYQNALGTSKDLTKAFNLFLEAANKNQPYAQNSLGLMYEEGQGVVKDNAKALEYYTLSANQGNYYGQYNVARFYYNGTGVTRDYQKALDFFTRAANQGYMNAYEYLGYMYDAGLGVAQDYKKALEYYTSAADKGSTYALGNMGLLYEYGRGVTQDYNKALELYIKANDTAKISAIKAKMNQTQITVATSSYNGTSADDAYAKGVSAYNKEDYSKAFTWFMQSANTGNKDGQAYVGYMYDIGKGVVQNYSKAFEYYTKAANQGDMISQYNLGLLYYNAHGVARDYKKAFDLFTKAANQGYMNAYEYLGYMYDAGLGVGQDYTKAMQYYMIASDKGSTYAQGNIGFLYEYGRGVAQDYDKAMQWYVKANDTSKIALLKSKISAQVQTSSVKTQVNTNTAVQTEKAFADANQEALYNYDNIKSEYSFTKAQKQNQSSYALIIGINKYKQNPPVEYADLSALAFKELAEKTLGIPKENIMLLLNDDATSGQIKTKIETITQLAEHSGNIYLYFAGHGVPAADGNTYILPSDMSADSILLEPNLKLDNIYAKLTHSEAKNVFVFIESCFSGKDDNGQLLYRGVAPVLKANKTTITNKKLTVMTAGGSSDFANEYSEKKQRLFSYFLISELAEGKKNLDAVYAEITHKVKRASLLKGIGYKQIPQIFGNDKAKIGQ